MFFFFLEIRCNISISSVMFYNFCLWSFTKKKRYFNVSQTCLNNIFIIAGQCNIAYISLIPLYYDIPIAVDNLYQQNFM